MGKGFLSSEKEYTTIYNKHLAVQLCFLRIKPLVLETKQHRFKIFMLYLEIKLGLGLSLPKYY